MNMFTTTTSIYHTKLRYKYEAEPVVVVPVVGIVVVPIRYTAVPRVVVPTTSTKHAVRAYFIHAVIILLLYPFEYDFITYESNGVICS